MSVTGGRSLADNPGDNTTNTPAASDIDRKFFEANGDLLAASIRAAQYATKVAFDSVIFGATEPPTTAELAATLQDFDADWHFGSSSKADWQAAVIAEKGHLFSVGKDLVKENYTSHLLTLQSLDVAICSLNRATIEAIWSSLSLELFYLTNDDEERYSIQAHQIILRNLTVQAADPPLGYPLYASEPIIINHLT
ncbi:PREDICTED: pecanex-like protein 4 [Rhagoletis zephyria]|uniref:pecanex-like protein 4 n=1 Tax=Rhagoletis zephyria TaxID=28612 RepID=UPI0008113880|nr:PREDICTED: pecanex-like protein 4 [Rhagoletis zephyria]